MNKVRLNPNPPSTSRRHDVSGLPPRGSYIVFRGRRAYVGVSMKIHQRAKTHACKYPGWWFAVVTSLPADATSAQRRFIEAQLYTAMLSRGFKLENSKPVLPAGPPTVKMSSEELWRFRSRVQARIRGAPMLTYDGREESKRTIARLVGVAPSTITSRLRAGTDPLRPKEIITDRMITVRGVTRTLSAWCRKNNIPKSLFYARLRIGWNEQDAVRPRRKK